MTARLWLVSGFGLTLPLSADKYAESGVLSTRVVKENLALREPTKIDDIPLIIRVLHMGITCLIFRMNDRDHNHVHIRPKISLVCPTRNEGPFLLEWIAWHRMLGFDDILVLSNDCVDGSDTLLDALSARGFIRHRPHVPNDGEPPLRSAYRATRLDPTLLAADWVMALDADEFLQIFVGNGSIHDLIALNGQECLGMAIYWKCFGSGGRVHWEDGFVREQFTMAATGQTEPNQYFKSIFRKLERFGKINSHSPRDFADSWGGQNIWVDCDGVKLGAVRLDAKAKHFRSTSAERITHRSAQVNHYVVKSAEGFALKSTQTSGSKLIYRHDAEFFEYYDNNDVEDMSALTREDAFAKEYAKIASDPEILRLHHACCANYAERLGEHAGDDLVDDGRF